MAIENKLQLPCGAVIANRLAKSAMSENIALDGKPHEKLWLLYDVWGQGGLGLIITGNVMVDSRELGEPGNVVLEDDADIDHFREWTSRAKRYGSQIWAQINHPGRQAPAAISKVTVAPSAVKLKIGSLAFRTPHALEEAEILEIIRKFGNTARLCKDAHFDGVQIHGAHGYLVSQFLSPLANQRSDRWGGNIENRMRFVLEIFRAMRAAVGREFPIGIKINSADFQRGGFDEDDAVKVAKALEAEGVDLIEISGGTYESAAMTGVHEARGSATGTMPSLSSTGLQNSTASREAYFLPFAAKIRLAVKTPIMLTGGFRSAAAMNAAIESGSVDVVGIARPLAMEPHLAKRLLSDPQAKSDIGPVKTGIAAIDRLGMVELGYYSLQLARIAEGKAPDPQLSPLLALPLVGFHYASGLLSRLLSK
ncbi:NADH:flavin oxidoreductase/NADH oxidase family protein [Turneriella parva]|uniref:NADH:flavin oxidoreductase/NADH oxidase n=1 Tax=Turneriella parva (strain ATCC BAA-1111 / DSM 21527 / NCTC 11395 / H) TaxID=869212 RepID=I4B6K6_TURPD|nr:NADH:flavin oxidoreductase/NADH oxidase family protein [Turneriella parva]AFM12913.1 NADH:flavin oxidoreductase/NADH oxidase [Turneriella parva DSM 21527]